ncbi:unnamed protein product [Blepharisma stoltei]|uniref:Uncharacterized protein n=1 Tax=Blepharisma stoltei TaxID=1481888 RepID=A0AAU9JCQ1_9CILI|nr:unnamed protein product [Blepharisma stoltei]
MIFLYRAISYILISTFFHFDKKLNSPKINLKIKMTNIPNSLFLRETGQLECSYFQMKNQYKSLTAISPSSSKRHSLRKGGISEIIPTSSFLFVITNRGCCLVLDKVTCKELFNLTGESEKTRTLFYNKANQSVILITLRDEDLDGRLICRSYPMESIEKGALESVPIFKDEDLRTPGFIEFDDTNQIILTRSATRGSFKFWRMNNYSLAFQIADPLVEEIRLSTDLVLLVYGPQGGVLTSKLVSIANGHLLNVYQIPIKPVRMIELLELFNQFLLLKQAGEPLVIFDLLQSTHILVANFFSPQAFIFLQEKMKFLALRAGIIELWDFQGNLLKTFHAPLCTSIRAYVPSRLYVTRKQDLLLICCSESRTPGRPSNVTRNDRKSSGVIKVLELMSGTCIAEIVADRLLVNVSTLAYDEYYGSIYTGHSNGTLIMWDN